jgi:hypothetical protein
MLCALLKFCDGGGNFVHIFFVAQQRGLGKPNGLQAS